MTTIETYNLEILQLVYSQLATNQGALAVQITHASKSNMSYRYTVHALLVEDGKATFRNITYLAAKLFGEKTNDKMELRGSGYGFDRRLEATIRFIRACENQGIRDPYSSQDSAPSRLEYSARRIDL